MNWYNAVAIGEGRATLGSDPSALMAAYCIVRSLQQRRPVITVCRCRESDKSFSVVFEFTGFFQLDYGKIKIGRNRYRETVEV